MGAGYEQVSGLGRTCTAVGSEPGKNFVNGTRYVSLAFQYQLAHKWK